MPPKKVKLSWSEANRASPDNWPDQRVNWRFLNRAQKAYAIKQYNVFRKNNNLPTIRNPFRKGAVGDESRTYMLDPKHPNAKLLPNYAGVETITKATSNVQLEPDNSMGKWLQKQQQFEIQQLEKLFEDPQFSKIVSTTASSLSIGDRPGTSGESNKKRPLDSTEAPVAKKNNLPTPPSSTPSTSTTTSTTEMPTSRPGTGNNEDVDLSLNNEAMPDVAEHGNRGYSGGFAASMEVDRVYVDKPLTVKGGRMVRFGKVHRMLTYGLASDYLPLTPAVTGVEVMTSSLVGIPWDCLFYYLNPGEQASLENGAKAHACHIRIVQRNPRVAFETNASDTALATLNQNKFGLKAIGLNKNQDIRMSDVNILTVQTGFNNMIPATVGLETLASKNTLDLAMYGVAQSNAAFTSTIPAQPFMIPLHYNRYAAFFNTTNGVANAAAIGWYDISKHIDQYDMGAMIGQEIVNMSYKFKDAPIKPQLPFADYLSQTINGVNYSNLSFNDHNTNKEFNQTNITSINNLTTSNPSETQTVKTTTRNNYDAQTSLAGFRSFLPLEKVQFSRNIDSDTNTSEYVQPSVHVGISPVPRLTTTGTTIPIQPNSWTDVQAYYEITATMEVFVPYEHHNTYGNAWHTNTYQVNLADGQVAVPNVPVRFGHYPQAAASALTLNNDSVNKSTLFKRNNK